MKYQFTVGFNTIENDDLHEIKMDAKEASKLSSEQVIIRDVEDASVLFVYEGGKLVYAHEDI